ncbi:MAG: alanine racemase [Armatimonadetes bacterium]|nr:alanine racemase [Armatimonadota bacterium]
MVPFRATWLEIDLDAIVHNYRLIRAQVGEGVGIMPIVKADAYGHGASEVAAVLSEEGADYFGVATLDEAVELRKAGITGSILLLEPGDPALAPEIIAHNLSQTLCNREMARVLSREAAKRGARVPVHLKVDTGLGRIGLFPEEVVPFLKAACPLPGLHFEGIFSHLASADSKDDTYFRKQVQSFTDVLEAVGREEIVFPLRHIANSAAILNGHDVCFEMVRPGIALYGHVPAKRFSGKIPLEPALSLKSKISFLKTVPRGTLVSYGCTYETKGDSLIATLPIGYGDGFSRLLSNKGQVLIGGKRYSVVGRVCMDHIMAELPPCAPVKVGDEAVLIGKQGNEEISATEVADLVGTIPYEVLCLFTRRVPRLYMRGEKPQFLRTLTGRHVFSPE